MDWIAAPNEMLALVVAIVLALLLISALILVKGRAAGVPSRLLHKQLIQVWVALLVALGTLLGARIWLGGPVVSGPADGLRLSDLSGAQWLVLAGAGLVMVACVLWARRAVAALVEMPTVVQPGDDDEPSC